MPKKKPPQQLRDIAETIENGRRGAYSWFSLKDLSLTQIPEGIFTLNKVEILDLSGNNLETIPEKLWDLPKLQEVWLQGNPIKTLPKRGRVRIDLSTYRRCRSLLEPQNTSLVTDERTSEEDVDWFLSEFDAVKGPYKLIITAEALMIHSSPSMPTVPMQRILKSLAKFDFVESLLLWGMQLDRVPVGIRCLHGIKNLRLYDLGLTTIPDWIGELNLESFSVSNNNLSSMPDSLGNLKNLQHLHLAWNRLTRIPSFVFELPALQKLVIYDTAIREIPPQILRLPQLKELVFRSDTIESPPPEVAAKGLEAIRNYWRQRADEGVDYLSEAKLIILGEPGAGKTSLADPSYPGTACGLRTEK